MTTRPATPGDMRAAAWRAIRSPASTPAAIEKALEILVTLDAAETGLDELMSIHLDEFLSRTRVDEQPGRPPRFITEPARDEAAL